MDFEKAIQESVEKMVSSGKVNEIIEKHLEETISSAVRDSVKSYSDFGKMIEKKLEVALNCTDITFPDYSQKMVDYVIEAVDSFMISDAKEKMQNQIKDFFKPLDYTKIKLSEIIEKFKKDLDEYDRENCDSEMTCIIEDDGNSFSRIYFDIEEDQDKYECSHCLALHTREGKKEVFDIKMEGKTLKAKRMSILDSFERLLFSLYSQKIEIIIDQVNTELNFDEEY